MSTLTKSAAVLAGLAALTIMKHRVCISGLYNTFALQHISQSLPHSRGDAATFAAQVRGVGDRIMQAKTVGRLTGIFVLAIAFVAANIGAPFAVTPADATPAIPIGQVKAAELRAEDEARAHLDRFFEFALSNAAARADPVVKIEIEGHAIWLEPYGQSDDLFSGIAIEASPAHMPGEVIEFTRNHVQDWAFNGRDNQLYGSFKTRASFARLKPESVTQLAAALSASPTPSWW